MILRRLFLWFVSFRIISSRKDDNSTLIITSLTDKKINLLDDTDNILVISIDGIGDTVLITPLLRELKRNTNTARITLLVSSVCFNLMERCPYVDEVLQIDTNVKGFLRGFIKYRRVKQFAETYLRKLCFDMVLLPRWDVDSNYGTYLAYFTGADNRIGFSESVNSSKSKWNKNYDLLLTHAVFDSSIKHEVEHNFDILRFIGGDIIDEHLELWSMDEDKNKIKQLFLEKNINTDNIVAVSTGAGHPKRKWPIDNYMKVVEFLVWECKLTVILIGGEGDITDGNFLEHSIGQGVINMAGRLTLRQAAVLLGQCCIFLGNDSGLAHVASAMRTSVIVLSCHPVNGLKESNNSPERFRPWQVKNTVIQPVYAKSPCLHECLANKSHCICDLDIQMVKDTIFNYVKNPINERIENRGKG